jgi:hypothetical protein
MARTTNKFAKMMETARVHQAPANDEKVIVPTPAPLPGPRGRGRPATGKRSDPDYETTTVFLRKSTKMGAARLLLGDKHQDLSDVLEKLLAEWVRKHA